MSIKKLVAAVIGLMVSSFVFAENYYLCLASFSKFENASLYMRDLTLKGYSTTLEPTVVKNKLYYRVLLAQSFDTLANAKKKKAEFARDTGKNDSWIFNADLTKKNLPVAAVAEAKKEFESEKKAGKAEKKVQVAERKNETTNAKPSDKPKTVEIKPATENAKPKTEEIRVEEIYVTRKTEEPKAVANVTDDTIEEKPVFETEIKTDTKKEAANTAIIKEETADKIQEIEAEIVLPSAAAAVATKADETIAKDISVPEIPEIQVRDLEISVPQKKESIDEKKPVQTVKYELSSAIETSVKKALNGTEIAFDEKSIPTTLTDSVKKLIKIFPMNANFKVEQIAFFDLENIRDGALSTETKILNDIELPFSFDVQDENFQAASLGRYEDVDFGEKVTVMMLSTSTNAFDSVLDNLGDETGENLQVEFKIDGEKFDCVMVKADKNSEKHLLFGTNGDKSVFIAIQAEEFSKTWLNRFVVGQLSSKESIFKNNIVRKSLFSLPYEEPKIDRRFLKFDLAKSGETVIREEGFRNKEHWNASAEFDQEDTVLKIDFCDID
ncbi:MAG: SPOR domain-containing protein [Treponema sp.]|nr:SPOR domain-containing protein [Treponema sp.]